MAAVWSFILSHACTTLHKPTEIWYINTQVEFCKPRHVLAAPSPILKVISICEGGTFTHLCCSHTYTLGINIFLATTIDSPFPSPRQVQVFKGNYNTPAFLSCNGACPVLSNGSKAAPYYQEIRVFVRFDHACVISVFLLVQILL